MWRGLLLVAICVAVGAQSEDDVFPVLQDTSPRVQNARNLLRNSRLSWFIRDWTPDQVEALQILWTAFITRDLKVKHQQWHGENSIGGIDGPGSGTVLIGFHGAIIQDLERFVFPGFRVPVWFPQEPIPPQLFIDPRYAVFGPRNTSFPNYQLPPFFTINGENGLSTADFRTPDDFGRAQGLFIHNSPHSMIGGPMLKSQISLSDPAFGLWHSFMLLQYLHWQLSTNGVVFARMFPNHPLLRPLSKDTFQSRLAFASEGVCSYSPEPVCQMLNQQQQRVKPLV